MTKRFSRRAALQGSTAIAALASVGCDPVTPLDGGLADAGASDTPRMPDAREMPDAGPPPSGPFQHGVASGDPFSDSVVLWTRISEASATTEVTWEVSETTDFAAIALTGTFSTDAARDYTVKVIAEGLASGTTYYYRFRVGSALSPIGRTRTAPTGATSRLRFAVASCASYAHGYFHGYARIAERADLDAVIHLGDYIYEYGTGEYGSIRSYEPANEIVSLSDYRTRYAQYRRDPDLLAAHRQHPFITTWDDHETANNSWRNGAENHSSGTEGSWSDRFAAASQAYREWMPFREGEGGRLQRALVYGDLVELIVLDTRIWGRDEQAAGADDPTLNSETRQLLGADQEAFLLDRLRTSTAQWKLICQQVMMATLPAFLNTDQWDGYPAQRRRLLSAIEDEAIGDVVVLTGDIHSSWAADVARDPSTYNPATGAGSTTVEVVVPGISSPGFSEALARTFTPIIEKRAPYFQYFDLVQRGYAVLDLDATRCQAAWFHVDDVTDFRAGTEMMSAALNCATGMPHWTEAAAAAAPRPDAPELAP
jgi:alkaline phosphatase D